MTDDVRLRLGNAETVEGKTVNHRNQAMTTRPTVSDSRSVPAPGDKETDAP